MWVPLIKLLIICDYKSIFYRFSVFFNYLNVMLSYEWLVKIRQILKLRSISTYISMTTHVSMAYLMIPCIVLFGIGANSLSLPDRLETTKIKFYIDALAKAYCIGYAYLTSFEALTSELQKAAKGQSPTLLEINEALIMAQIESITPL